MLQPTTSPEGYCFFYMNTNVWYSFTTEVINPLIIMDYIYLFGVMLSLEKRTRVIFTIRTISDIPIEAFTFHTARDLPTEEIMTSVTEEVKVTSKIREYENEMKIFIKNYTFLLEAEDTKDFVWMRYKGKWNFDIGIVTCEGEAVITVPETITSEENKKIQMTESILKEMNEEDENTTNKEKEKEEKEEKRCLNLCIILLISTNIGFGLLVLIIVIICACYRRKKEIKLDLCGKQSAETQQIVTRVNGTDEREMSIKTNRKRFRDKK